MSMWRNDVLYGGERLDQVVTIGTTPQDSEPVMLLDARVVADDVPTSLGMASKTMLVIAKRDGGEAFSDVHTVGTLASTIAEKVKMRTDDDLPAIVCFMRVTGSHGTEATVMQFIRRPRRDEPVPEFEALDEPVPF